MTQLPFMNYFKNCIECSPLQWNSDVYLPFIETYINLQSLLHKSVENTLLLQQHHQHHQEDEYCCLHNHAPCFVCRQVILKINLFIKCVIINFIFPPSAECQGRTKTCGEKKDRKACNAEDGCEWKNKKSKCEAKEMCFGTLSGWDGCGKGKGNH